MRGHAKALFAVMALLSFMLLGASPALAAKGVFTFFGNSGSTPAGNEVDGGLFSTPRGVATNVAGTGGATAGDIYVVNSSAHRVDQFSASGSFIRAFGQDVIEEGKANSNTTGFEICDTTAGNAAADCKAGITSAATGGALSSPQGIAIDQATGNVYVTSQGFLRVEVYDATGHFLRAFGQDVVSAGANNKPATAAKQTLTVDATEGQLKLSFRGQTTADIAFNASAAEVDAALEALTTVGAGNVAVTGGPGGPAGGTPYVIAFAGALNNAPMPLISTAAGTTPLAGGAGASVANTTTGSTGYEVCVAGVDTCKTGVTASSAGAFKSTFNGHIAVAPTGAPNAGNVLVADPANMRVNEYTSTGAFVRSFGYDVTSSPPNSTTTFEICDAANLDVCKIGAAGANTGQFGLNAANRVAVDSSGAIYTVEGSPNFRVQKFTPAGPTLTPAAFAEATLKGTSATDAPTEIAIGASDKVFVVKFFPVGTGTPPAASAERRILELSSAGALLDTHLASAAITSVNGLAANPANGRLYISSATTPHRVYILADAPAPVATIDPVSAISATAATFNGKVNPGGVLGEHHFEYVDDATFQATGFASANVLPDEESGNASTPQTVSRAVSGLSPSTLYHVRLVAEHKFTATSSVSAETTFTTTGATPTVAPFAVAGPGVTQASLFSRVTPNGQATTYRFEWGPTAAYGNLTPVQNAGSGTDSVFASAQISGLSPDTLYHFRLVATNAAGTSQGPDHVFTTDSPQPSSCPNAEFRTGVGAFLPDCRAYEQVSPIDKNGSNILWNAGGFGGAGATGGRAVSEAGDAAITASFGEFADIDNGSNTTDNEYFSRRSSEGWETVSMVSRPLDRAAAEGGGRIKLVSEDLGLSWIESEAQLVPDSVPDGMRVYLRDNEANALSHLLTLPTFNGFVSPVGSLGLEHVAFGTYAMLTSDPGMPGESVYKVFELEGEEVRLASVKPDGTPFETGTWPAGGGFSGGAAATLAGGVSDDGEHIFFSVDSGTGSVYRRSNATTTVLVSPSKRVPADPQGPRQKRFRGATADGDRVLFVSSELLTDDANTGPTRAGSDLYRYDIGTDRLVDISATAGGDGARVQGVYAFDRDIERVYYTALGQVVPGQGTAGQKNLYLWEDDGTADGRTRFVATLASGDSPGAALEQITADGRYLLFQSTAEIPGFATGGVRQVYRYDAEAEDGAGKLECISCNPEENPPLGPSFLTPNAMDVAARWETVRSLSADGQRAFFTSQDALLPADTNGLNDAYMWEDGELHLLSSGSSSEDSFFYNASLDGDDAFVLTAEPLVPQDRDTASDLYTAHVNGGFAAQFATPPPTCAGEECRGAGTQEGAGPAPTTSTFQGEGNPPQPKRPRCRKGQRRVKARNGKTRCVKKKRNRANSNRRAGR